MPGRTRRHVSQTEAAEAADEIAERRRTNNDPDLESFSHEPLAAVEYVLTKQQVHAGVLAEDVLSALTLLEFARGNVPAIPKMLDGYEYDLLTLGMRFGVSLSAMAKELGLASR